LRAHAIALFARGAHAANAPEDALAVSRDLRMGERLGIASEGPSRIRFVAAARDVVLRGVIFPETGPPTPIERKQELVVDVLEGSRATIEVEASAPTSLEVRTNAPDRLHAPERVTAFRSTQARPVVVEAPAGPLVLRVSARSPIAANTTSPAPIAFDVDVGSGRGGERAGRTVEAEREASKYDRYEGGDREVPSEKMTFYAVVPLGGTLTLRPRARSIDFVIAELDPSSAQPNPVFTSRRPSNVALFAADGLRTLSLGRRGTQTATPAPAPAHAKKPPRAPTRVVDGKTYVASSEAIEVTTNGDALALPMRFLRGDPGQITIRVDADEPRRVSAGVAERVTLPRILGTADALHANLILGDDLTAGRHIISIKAPAGTWVHAPWASAPPPKTRSNPHWIAGDFDE
jgi:hypothetical protein